MNIKHQNTAFSIKNGKIINNGIVNNGKKYGANVIKKLLPSCVIAPPRLSDTLKLNTFLKNKNAIIV